MEEIDYDKLYSSLQKYGASPEFKLNQETHELYGLGTAMVQVAGRQSVTMTTLFPMEGFKYFVRDLYLMKNLNEEEYIRSHNPTVQRAYEEYQLLLKLSR